MTHNAEKDAPRLTEAEWRRAEAQRECRTFGHDWEIVQTFGGIPTTLYCSRRCGAPTYSVTPPANPEPGDPQ